LELLCAGFNVETVEYKNISFTVWDVGGQDKVHAFVFVSVKRLCTVICGKFEKYVSVCVPVIF
jgi:GTPase SAR1 family protein